MSRERVHLVRVRILGLAEVEDGNGRRWLTACDPGVKVGDVLLFARESGDESHEVLRGKRADDVRRTYFPEDS